MNVKNQSLDDRDLTNAYLSYEKCHQNLSKVIRGQADPIRLLLASYFCGGHVLIEDYPGTGKTTLAKALAKSVQCSFSRIQFTPDMLPSDILGVSIFDPKEQAFNFHKGPIFTQILLADEINRASPRTQSALLEAMAEKQVTIDGHPYQLDPHFFVMATQNPVEFQGTYPLPEAQMDRFNVRIHLGYLSNEEEAEMLKDQNEKHPLDVLGPCMQMDELNNLRDASKCIRISDNIRDYIVKIVSETRSHEKIRLGASPRASIAIMSMARCLALFDQKEYVSPEHVQELAGPVLAHRILLDSSARYSGAHGLSTIDEIVKSIDLSI